MGDPASEGVCDNILSPFSSIVYLLFYIVEEEFSTIQESTEITSLKKKLAGWGVE